ncbi:Exosome non-catalytic core component [Ascosphaera acerosa]|nr:Exosome non-catalytic core component [Ascosphaera acerosa]
MDTATTYQLTRLRLDGRRWNELRSTQAQISTSPASSGSAYVTMGNTVVIATVNGPAELKRSETGGVAGSPNGASVVVGVNIAGFAGVDRKKSERQSQTDLSTALRDAFQPHIHAHIYPHSTIALNVSVLSSDGSLLAACINACTLALVDAGIPMPGLLTACTVGMSGRASTPAAPTAAKSGAAAAINESLDPLLDLSLLEEQELPFLTIATTTPLPGGGEGAADGGGDGEDEEEYDGGELEEMVSVVQMEKGVHVSYLDTMLAVGLDGCKQVREILTVCPHRRSVADIRAPTRAANDGGEPKAEAEAESNKARSQRPSHPSDLHSSTREVGCPP